MAAQLRFCPAPSPHSIASSPRHILPPLSLPKFPSNTSSSSSSSSSSLLSQSPFHYFYPISSPHHRIQAGGGDGGSAGYSGGGGSGDGSGDGSDDRDGFGPVGAFLNGWRARVAADPQFPFKVLMEELVGVTACVLGDMASRPNFGLNELDFVFSTLVVGSILNFVLMYLLAPTAAAATSAGLPSIFAGCPPSHMFEPGAYGLASRLGTLVYKGTLFAGVGFAAGLVGTALSNGLIAFRKRMDPNFETPNKAPPTLLNASTWALHMGISSNLRYQTLNGVEYLLGQGLPPLVFKSSVVVLRCLNNVMGGMSFVLLARLTGSQSSGKPSLAATEAAAATTAADDEKHNLIHHAQPQPESESSAAASK